MSTTKSPYSFLQEDEVEGLQWWGYLLIAFAIVICCGLSWYIKEKIHHKRWKKRQQAAGIIGDMKSLAAAAGGDFESAHVQRLQRDLEEKRRKERGGGGDFDGARSAGSGRRGPPSGRRAAAGGVDAAEQRRGPSSGRRSAAGGGTDASERPRSKKSGSSTRAGGSGGGKAKSKSRSGRHKSGRRAAESQV